MQSNAAAVVRFPFVPVSHGQMLHQELWNWKILQF